MAGVTALLVAANWGIYVWVVTTGRALDAALGYYINPLFSIALGALLLFFFEVFEVVGQVLLERALRQPPLQARAEDGRAVADP
jgi:RarD protein